MKQFFFKSLALALFLTGALHSSAHAKGVSGAIFTTTFDGSVVNGNKFSSKCDVYLDGGPGPNAPAKAAGLPDGDYYFQVTDPNGSQLLSTDPVSNRRFTVTGGVISGHSGTHPTGIDMDHGAVTIALADVNCPVDFLDTPNNGGVYKVWATPVGDFAGDPTQVDNPCGGGCFHGFVASKSKTDNFKVQAPPATTTFCLTLGKVWSDRDENQSPLANWEIVVDDTLETTNSYFTGDDGLVQTCGLIAGSYVVTEVLQEGTQIFGLNVNGVDVPEELVDITYGFTWDASKPEPVIIFINEEKPADPDQ